MSGAPKLRAHEGLDKGAHAAIVRLDQNLPGGWLATTDVPGITEKLLAGGAVVFVKGVHRDWLGYLTPMQMDRDPVLYQLRRSLRAHGRELAVFANISRPLKDRSTVAMAWPLDGVAPRELTGYAREWTPMVRDVATLAQALFATEDAP